MKIKDGGFSLDNHFIDSNPPWVLVSKVNSYRTFRAAMSPLVFTTDGVLKMATKMQIRTHNVSIATFMKW